MIRVICFIKKAQKKSAIISMREPRSLCVSMCACVITMMDGAGGLYFVSSTKGLDQTKRRERPQHRTTHTPGLDELSTRAWIRGRKRDG